MARSVAAEEQRQFAAPGWDTHNSAQAIQSSIRLGSPSRAVGSLSHAGAPQHGFRGRHTGLSNARILRRCPGA